MPLLGQVKCAWYFVIANELAIMARFAIPLKPLGAIMAKTHDEAAFELAQGEGAIDGCANVKNGVMSPYLCLATDHIHLNHGNSCTVVVVHTALVAIRVIRSPSVQKKSKNSTVISNASQ